MLGFSELLGNKLVINRKKLLIWWNFIGIKYGNEMFGND